MTVVVPNFNHAAFLKQRLDSIYRQTYRNLEVILLDDQSTDGSLSILRRYQKQYPRITTLIPNHANSGSPFRQWSRGIQRATGGLIWIAESDDFCDSDFLERLVPFFRDEAVNLAYCQTQFVDVRGRPLPSTFYDYLQEISPVKWAGDYVETAHREVREALGIKNTIPNVSGVLFRKPTCLSVLNDVNWLQMRICGDWVFYLHVIRGGKIAYTRNTTNYYRYHTANTSSASQHRQIAYYKEHELVAKTVARLYDAEGVSERQHDLLRSYWISAFRNHKWPSWSLDEAYNLDEILKERHKRLPNILIACHDLSGGGGEIFPIRLAVELQRQGFGVTFFDFNGLVPNPEFRRNLPAGIPVIQRNERLKDIASLITDLGIEVVHTGRRWQSIERCWQGPQPALPQQSLPLAGARLTVPTICSG